MQGSHPIALLRCPAWDRALQPGAVRFPGDSPDLEAEGTKCLCVPHLPGQEELWIQGGAGVGQVPNTGPKHTLPCWPSPQGSFGMGSLWPEHLPLAKGGINSCPRLLGLGRAGQDWQCHRDRLWTSSHPVKGHEGASPADEWELSHPAPPQATGVRPWRNLSAAEATAALGSQAVGPQLKTPLKSHFFPFNCTDRGTDPAFPWVSAALGIPWWH